MENMGRPGQGSREALGTIWNSYLAEVLQVSPKSEIRSSAEMEDGGFQRGP